MIKKPSQKQEVRGRNIFSKWAYLRVSDWEQSISNEEIRSSCEGFYGKLGFFDSGIGGLEVMKEFRMLHSDLDMVYFGDRANCPYGGRSGWEIRSLVESGVEFLVEKWCVIIILACNTAVAHAIKYLQNEKYPPGSPVKVLGVTVPGAEKVVELWYKKVGVLATVATVNEGMYRDRVRILSSQTVVQEISAPGLVDLIEKDCRNWELIDRLLSETLVKFDPDIEVLILGCTHYPILSGKIQKVWRKFFHRDIILIDPGKEAAERFTGYLERHSEYAVSRWGVVEVLFSKNSHPRTSQEYFSV